MTEIPEHLLARAKAAREKAAAQAMAEPAETAPAAEATPAAEPEPEVVETDEAREALLELVTTCLGDALVGSHIVPGRALWVRVGVEAWLETASVVRHRAGLRLFDFLSAIDWLPSPFGRDMDSQVDNIVHGTDAKEPDPMQQGYAGGATRFQLLASMRPANRGPGVLLKCDLPDDDLTVESLIPVYAGANWHERETWEMFGINFTGHPDIRHIYLPGEFEGHPLRKDFPLLARRIKPWPGIVDVEAMPGEDS